MQWPAAVRRFVIRRFEQMIHFLDQTAEPPDRRTALHPNPSKCADRLDPLLTHPVGRAE